MFRPDQSFFKTSTGKVVACGSNKYGRLILRGDKQDVFPPEETTITGNVTFLESAQKEDRSNFSIKKHSRK